MSSEPRIESFNPATEEVLATFAPSTPEQIDRALSAAQDAFRRCVPPPSPSAPH